MNKKKFQLLQEVDQLTFTLSSAKDSLHSLRSKANAQLEEKDRIENENKEMQALVSQLQQQSSQLEQSLHTTKEEIKAVDVEFNHNLSIVLSCLYLTISLLKQRIHFFLYKKK